MPCNGCNGIMNIFKNNLYEYINCISYYYFELKIGICTDSNNDIFLIRAVLLW